MSENMIEDSIQRLLTKEVHRELLVQVESGNFASELWNTIVDAGMTKILCREEHGGIEAEWTDAFPLFFQTGLTQAPVPLSQAVLGQYFASRGGLDLPPRSVFSLAVGPQASALTTTRDSAGRPKTLSGSLKSMKWARHANWLMCELTDGIALVEPRSHHINISPAVDAASMPADSVELDRAPITHWIPNTFDGLGHPLRASYAAATAAQLTGALEYALQLSIQYAKDRVQFGKPIGKNQAIQHQLAVLAGEVACSYAATTTAMRDLPSIHKCEAFKSEFSAAVAKIITSDAVKSGASIAHQVHGAIGFTYEYPLNFATRRMWAWRSEAGSSTEWARLLGKAFCTSGADEFWPHLTERRMPPQVTESVCPPQKQRTPAHV